MSVASAIDAANPVDEETGEPLPRAVDLGVAAWFNGYMAFIVVVIFYIIGYLLKRTGWRRVSEIDVDSGRRDMDYEQFEALKAKRAAWPAWRRVMDKLI